MDKFQRGVRTLATTGLAVLMCLVLLWLLLLSIFNTCYLDILENMLFLHGNVTFSVLGILATIALFVFGHKLRTRIKLPSRAACDKIILACAGLTALYVVAVQSIPSADQQAILRIADNMHMRNFSEFLGDGYMLRYPHQYGLVLFFYCAQFLFGGNNALFAQILNVVSLYVIWRCMYRLAEAWFGDGIRARLTLVVTLAFLPLTFYVVFVYGTLYGMALSLAGFVMLERWFAQRKWKYIAAGGILMALAIQAKSNYSICLVAYILFLLLEAILQHTNNYISVLQSCIQLCAGIVLPLVLTLCCSLGVDAAMYAITNVEKSEGMPSISWVAMGLQEEPPTTERILAPGYYNAYNWDLYTETGYDTAQTSAISREYIRQRIGEFIEHPAQAALFFSRKNAAQWTEPTFESLVIQTGRPNAISLAPWYTALCTQGSMLEQTLWTVYDVFQSIIYFGALACFITRLRRGEVFQWTLAVTFLGGFLFHLVWELKGQYALFYFVLLIPYAVQGYADCAQHVVTRPARSGKICAGAAVALILLVVTPLHGAVALERRNDRNWFIDSTEWRRAPLVSGDYTVVCKGGGAPITLHFQEKKAWGLGETYYVITQEGKPLAAEIPDDLSVDWNGANVSFLRTDNGGVVYHWMLQHTADGYIFFMRDAANTAWMLTSHGDTATLELPQGTPAQAFQIVPATEH